MMKLCLIGHPVNHSLSPLIYDYLCPKFDKVCTYDLIDIKSDDFSSDIVNILDQYDGFNITVPHKRKMVKYLENQDGLEALNFAVRQNGQWLGKNTDILGLLLALDYHSVAIKGKKVAILGAGGAAISAMLAMEKVGAEIAIFNRTKEKAQDLIEKMQIKAKVYSLEDYKGGYDVTIQCTSVGLKDKSQSPITGSFSGIGYDMVYGEKQRFLSQFEEAYDGASMLVGQALYNFHYWFDLPLESLIPYYDEVLNEIKK